MITPRRRRGTFLILLVAGMTLFLGAAALVTDVGYAYVERQRTQGVLDAAVLATMATLDAGDPAEAEVATRRLKLMLAANGVDPERIEDLGFDRRRLGATLEAKANVDTAAFLAGAFGIAKMRGRVEASAEGDLAAPPAGSSAPKGSLQEVCGGCSGEPKECSELRDIVGDMNIGSDALANLGSGSGEAYGAGGPRVVQLGGGSSWTFGGDADPRRSNGGASKTLAPRVKELLRRISESPSPGCTPDAVDEATAPPRTEGPYGGVRLAP